MPPHYLDKHDSMVPRLAGLTRLSSLAAVVAMACTSDLSPASQSRTIVDGVPDSEHSEVVALVAQDAYCTGTVIGSRAVLTAAHCFEFAEFREFGLDVALHQKSVHEGQSVDESTGRMVAIRDVLLHPDWDRKLLSGPDLAIVLTADDLSAAPVELATEPPHVGQTVRSVGYGRPSVGQRKRAATMVEEVQSVHFTTRPVDGISCQGDSGGPALIERNGQWVLAGVLHAGDSECESNAHTTRIDPYLGWVERVLAEQIIDDSPPQLHGETASLQADGDLYYLAVDATDAGSGVASVSVIVDGQLIGMDDEAPFRVPVGRLKTGEHTFELRARDRAWNYGTGTVTVSTDGAEPLDSSDDNSMTGGCASSGGSAGEIGLMLIAVLAVLVRRRSSRLSWHATWRLLGPALILCVMPGKGQADSDRCRAAGGNWFDRPTPHCICPDGLGLSPTGSCTATSMTFRGVFVIAGENYLRPHLVRIDADGFATDLYEFDTCVAEIGTDSAREHIFVYHPGEGRILRLSRSGALETWAQDDRLVDTGDCNSSASTMGPDGTWYLRVDADDHYSRLVAIDTDSPAIEVLAGGYEYYGELRGDPIGGKTSYLALGPDGSLYSSGRCSPEGCPIVRRSPDGAFTDVGEPVDRVDAIAWTPDGLIVLETSDAVTRAVVVGDDNSRRSLQVDDRLSASRISVLSSGDLMTVSTGYVSSHRPPEAILRLSLTGHVSTVSMFQGQALWNVIGFAVLD